MAQLVAAATGNLSAAATWNVGNLRGASSNVTGTGQVYTLPRGTANFTPTAGKVCIGVVFYIAYVNNTADGTITAQLRDGTTVLASGSIRCHAHNTVDQNSSPYNGYCYIQFTTPYTYPGSPSATHNFNFTSSSSVAVRMGWTGMGTVEVLSDTQAPATGDSLFICGYASTSAAMTQIAVTVDTSLSLAASAFFDSSLFAIHIGKGGSLTWGASQAASYTLTFTTGALAAIHLTGNDSGVNAFEMGTPANPLSSGYVQTCIVSIATTPLLYLGEYYGSLTATALEFSINGNSAFNQASASLWRSYTESSAASGQKNIVLAEDMGLRAGGGDILYIEATEAKKQGEFVTVASYDSATKTVVASVNLTNLHAAGAKIYTVNCNACVDGISASNAAYITYNGYSYSTGIYVKATINYVSQNFGIGSGSLSPFCLSGCTFSNIRLRGASSAIYFRWGINMPLGVTVEDCFVHSARSNTQAYISYSKIIHKNCVFCASHATGGFSLSSSSTHTFNSCRFLSCGFDNTIASNVILQDCYMTPNDLNYNFRANTADGFSNTFKNITTNANETCTNFLESNTASLIHQYRLLNVTHAATNLVKLADISALANGSYFCFQNIQGNALDGRVYKPEGYVLSTGATLADTTTKTAGQLSLGFFPTSTSLLPLTHTIKKPVKANQTVAWYGFMRKNSSYGSSTLPFVTLTSDDGEIDSEATMTDIDDTWVLFSVSGQVGSGNTVINLIITAQSANASAACYFADMQLVIGDATAGSATGFKVATLWKDGEPTADEVLGGTVDKSFLEGAVWDALTADHAAADTFGKKVADGGGTGGSGLTVGQFLALK